MLTYSGTLRVVKKGSQKGSQKAGWNKMAIEKLNDRQVKAITQTTTGKADGGGLYFRGKGNGEAEVFFVYNRHGIGKYRMYLGLYPAMTLATARAQAAKWRAVQAAGDDPKTFKEQTEKARRFPPRTLADVSVEYWEEEKKPTLFHGHKPNQWFNPMRLYILPALGKRNMESISVPEMASLLKKTRNHSNDQARKAIYCLRQIYKYARAVCGQELDRNFMDDVEDGLKIDHRGRRKKQTGKAFVPVNRIAAFYQSLGTDLDDLAIRFLIVTALRPQNTRWLQWDEIVGNNWVMEGDRMKVKSDEDYVQPLTDEAMVILRAAYKQRHPNSPYVFHNAKAFKTGVITENRINNILKDREVFGADGMRTVTGHGFRSTFQGWGFQQLDIPRELASECMAHCVVKGASINYDQDPRLEERRMVLQRWAETLTDASAAMAKAPNIVPLFKS